MPKLPLWKIVLASNKLLWSNRDQLVAVMWAWLLVMLPAYALAHWIDARAPWLSLDSLIELPFLASVAVGWHRLLLEGRRITAPYLNLDGAVLRYTLYSFVIWLMWLPLSLLPETNDDVTWPLLAAVLGVLAAILLFGRLSLIFPAIAVGRPMSLAQSWHLTRRNTFRIFWGSLLAIVPVLTLLVLIEISWPDTPGIAVKIAKSTLFSVVLAIGLMSGVSFLSLTYRFFVSDAERGA